MATRVTAGQSSSLQSSASSKNREDDGTLSSIWFLASASSKSHTVSPVWKYFAYFDLGHHPGMKYHRIFVVCFDKGFQTKINCSKYYTPMPLVNHLRSAHKEQYKEYLVALSNAKKKRRQKFFCCKPNINCRSFSNSSDCKV
jgi:hypothetical protein